MNHNEAVLKAIKDILGTSPDPEGKVIGSLTLTEDKVLSIFVGCPDKRYTVVGVNASGNVRRIKSFKQWGSCLNHISALQANDLPFMVYDCVQKKALFKKHRSEDVMKSVFHFVNNTLGIEVKENTND